VLKVRYPKIEGFVMSVAATPLLLCIGYIGSIIIPENYAYLKAE
jgi:hypothetical protein